MFFKSCHHVKSYFCYFLGSDSNRIRLLFGLIHPLTVDFAVQERMAIKSCFSQMTTFFTYFFQLELNGWSSKFFQRSVSSTLIYKTHALEAQAKWSFCLYFLLVIFYSYFICAYIEWKSLAQHSGFINKSFANCTMKQKSRLRIFISPFFSKVAVDFA